MGYSKDSSGRLCCDFCGHAGGVKKVPCTYGFCQAPAFCAECRSNPEVMSEFRAHCREHCKPASEAFAAREALRAELLAGGAFVRTSAIGTGDGMVDVTFRDSAGHEMVLAVSTEAYDSVSSLTPATPSDFGVSALVAG